MRTGVGRFARVLPVLLLGFAVVAPAACVPLAGGWSIEEVARRYPEVRLPRGQRLADTPPHFWPAGDGAWLFLCRFETDQPIGIALPDQASEAEREDLRLAMRAWSDALTDLRFRETTAEEARIVIRYDDANASGLPPIPGTGLTVTDCDVDELALLQLETPQVVPARLARSLVILGRSNLDSIGRPVPLTRDEHLGAALHELGHALGFGGHVGSEASIMTRTTARTRAIAKRVRVEGRLNPKNLASVAALYALPNGIVVGKAAVTASFDVDIARARVLARARGWRGPIVRVGERSAQLHWRHGDAMAGRLAITDYSRALRSGEPLEFAATRFARIVRAGGRAEE